MWPHSFVVGIGDTAICVGTDDAVVASLLEPWVVDVDATLTDLVLAVHPDQSGDASTRPLGVLRRGSAVIARSMDHDALRDGLLRCLSTLGGPETPGRVRVRAVPVRRDDGCVLVPQRALADLSHRWLVAHALDPVFVDEVEIDPTDLTVHIARPWGTDAPALPGHLDCWILPGAEPASTGLLVRDVAHLLAQPPVADVGSRALGHLVEVVRQAPLRFVGTGGAALRDALSARNG